ncbi:MAG: hypothetical protein M1833_006173 [Piccolia ochrophora]|nr:MAG: hypothetical protein M1833_006173 [Piccolia ochrophora]
MHSLLIWLFLFALCWDCAFSQEESIRHFECGTPPPAPDTLSTIRDLNDKEVVGSPAVRARAVAGASKSLVVRTYFHVLTTRAKNGSISRATMNNQFSILQGAYARSDIKFDNQRSDWVDWTVNDAWAQNTDEANMKRTLRKGTYASLNVYFHTDPAGNLLGKCTMPGGPIQPESPNFYNDGCNVATGSLPQGNIGGYNLGKTTVHEVGHWLGLLHTFEGSSCTGKGDYIADTPAQASSTDGCPTNSKDSCPNATGYDPIHNYMDYSFDRCYTEFTPLQGVRMLEMWDSYRMGK